VVYVNLFSRDLIVFEGRGKERRLKNKGHDALGPT
jgi:hypothetical protein